MAVVTISREIGSEGGYIGKKVADELGYHFVDKIMLAGVLQQVGLIEFGQMVPPGPSTSSSTRTVCLPPWRSSGWSKQPRPWRATSAMAGRPRAQLRSTLSWRA